MSSSQERLLSEAKAASEDAAGALVKEMDAMREAGLAAALAEARASVAALQRQHEAGQNSIAQLQVRVVSWDSKRQDETVQDRRECLCAAGIF